MDLDVSGFYGQEFPNDLRLHHLRADDARLRRLRLEVARFGGS